MLEKLQRPERKSNMANRDMERDCSINGNSKSSEVMVVNPEYENTRIWRETICHPHSATGRAAASAYFKLCTPCMQINEQTRAPIFIETEKEWII